MKEKVESKNREPFDMIMLASEYVVEGHFEQALALLNKAKKHNNKVNNFAALKLAEIYYVLGDLPQAIHEANEILERKSKTFSGNAHDILVKCYWDYGNRKKTEKHLQIAIKQKTAHAYVNLAQFCLKYRCDYEKGIEAVKQAINLNSYILNPNTLKKGEEKNPYSIQDVIVKDFQNIFSLSANLYSAIGDYETMEIWEKRLKTAQKANKKEQGEENE